MRPSRSGIASTSAPRPRRGPTAASPRAVSVPSRSWADGRWAAIAAPRTAASAPAWVSRASSPGDSLRASNSAASAFISGESVRHVGFSLTKTRDRGRLRPYGLASVGRYSWHSVNSFAPDADLEFARPEIHRSFLGASVGGGAHWRARRNLSLDVEGRWHTSLHPAALSDARRTAGALEHGVAHDGRAVSLVKTRRPQGREPSAAGNATKNGSTRPR